METYISIVVPYFNRIHYLKQLIDSVHNYADMPFELLVHDDASVDGSTPEVFSLRDKMSVFIIGTGHNVGLPTATNRLVNIARSNFIIFLNADCVLNSPCLKKIVDILSKPYIGCLFLSNSTLNKPYIKTLSGAEFNLSGIGDGCAIAFRKEVWKEVGGWDEEVHSGVSDVVFVIRILLNGYFLVYPYEKRFVDNLSLLLQKNKDSSMCASGYDASYSKIFKLSNFDKECKNREEMVNKRANSLINVEASITNLGYWRSYLSNLGVDKGVKSINWDVAKKHGQDRWKDIMIKEELTSE